MEISQELKTVLDKLTDSNGLIALEEATAYKYITEELEDILDSLGEQSQKSRGLPQPITSSVKFHK